jgi:hypothetical protein
MAHVLTVIFPAQEGSSPKAPRFASAVVQMLLAVHSTGVEIVNGSALGYFMPFALADFRSWIHVGPSRQPGS